MSTHFWTGDESAAVAERVAPGAITKVTESAAYIAPERLVETMTALRDDADADLVYLANLCGADYWDHLEVVYHLASFEKNHLGTFKVECWERDDPVLPSVVPVWYGAWMQECEAYDLFGIKFEGHPNLHRILLWEGFPGWPLRKDFLSMPGGLQPGLNEFAGTARRDAPPVRVVEE